MKGRALVDIPALSLKCGDYCEIPDSQAKYYIELGAFDKNAVDPKQQEEKRKPK